MLHRLEYLNWTSRSSKTSNPSSCVTWLLKAALSPRPLGAPPRTQHSCLTCLENGPSQTYRRAPVHHISRFTFSDSVFKPSGASSSLVCPFCLTDPPVSDGMACVSVTLSSHSGSHYMIRQVSEFDSGRSSRRVKSEFRLTPQRWPGGAHGIRW